MLLIPPEPDDRSGSVGSGPAGKEAPALDIPQIGERIKKGWKK